MVVCVPAGAAATRRRQMAGSARLGRSWLGEVPGFRGMADRESCQTSLRPVRGTHRMVAHRGDPGRRQDYLYRGPGWCAADPEPAADRAPVQAVTPSDDPVPGRSEDLRGGCRRRRRGTWLQRLRCGTRRGLQVAATVRILVRGDPA